jgi:hypothetical protein
LASGTSFSASAAALMHIVDGDFHAAVGEALVDLAARFQERVEFDIDGQREVRDIAEAFRHALGDGFAHEIERHEIVAARADALAFKRLERRRRLLRRGRARDFPRLLRGARRLGSRFNVRLHDAPIWAGALEAAQINAALLRKAARQR